MYYFFVKDESICKVARWLCLPIFPKEVDLG